MKSFTLGSSEMLAAMESALPEKYPMALNPADMAVVIHSLAEIGQWQDGVMADAALSLLSDIATTLGIEGI